MKWGGDSGVCVAEVFVCGAACADCLAPANANGGWQGCWPKGKGDEGRDAT